MERPPPLRDGWLRRSASTLTKRTCCFDNLVFFESFCSLQEKESHHSIELENVTKDRDSLKSTLESLQGKSTDEVYQAQVREVSKNKSFSH